MLISNSQGGSDQRIRRVIPNGLITTIAGGAGSGDSGDGGPATQARFRSLAGMAVAPDGSILIADSLSHRVRKISTPLPGFTAANIAIASEDGSQLYRFDANGRHLSTVNALTGAVLHTFAYNSQGSLITITDADGNITRIERHADGNPLAIVAPFGQRTVLTVDGNGYLASVANPAGETFQMSYTAGGLLTRFTDPKGNASDFIYDNLGRLQRDSNAAGGNQTLARTDITNGFEVARTTALGRTTRYRLEDLAIGDRQRVIRFPDGTETQMLIGRDGSTRISLSDGTVDSLLEGPDPRFSMQAPVVTSLTTTTGGLTATLNTERTVNLADPNNPLSLSSLTERTTLNGRTATDMFNAATRTTTSTSAAGRQSTTVIDTQGRITQAQIAGLFPVNVGYDNRGRLSSVTQGAGADTRPLTFSYNSSGYLQTVTDPLNRTLGYEYDAAGRITRQTLPDGRQIFYGYDANGNLTSLTPPGRPAHVFTYTPVDLQEQYTPPNVGAGANSTVYAYNADKQLTQITRPDNETLGFTYDSAGRLSTLTLPGGQISYGYNATTGKLSSITAPDGGTLAYTYNGALLTQTAWTGTVAGSVSRTYDNDFRVTALSVNGANPIAFQYDADSLLTKAGDLTLSRNAQNGLLTGTALGSVSDTLTYNGFGEVTGYSANYTNSTLFSTQYTYDKLGRITRKVEIISGVTNTFDYGYDQAGRLIEVKQNGTTVSSYSYDANGNRLSRTTGGSTINGTYDSQDRLLQYGNNTYTYTANGELLSKATGGQITGYEYDVLGNLKRVTLPGGTVIEYVTDGSDRRIGKKVNGTMVRGFLYQDQLKPAVELDGSGNVVSRFVYATGINVPDYMIKGGATYRLITDYLGSPRLVVNITNGSIIQRIDYDEFGNVTQDTNPGFQPFGFAGGLYDKDIGLLRFGARDYDPETGRWTAKDPIGFAGGDLNLYSYVVNNPLIFVDPFGFDEGIPSIQSNNTDASRADVYFELH